MKGRPKKPTALRLIDGNPGKRPINRNEPQPEPGVPSRPDWLPTRAHLFWEKLCDELEPMRVVTHADVFALAMLADCLAEWKQAAEAGKSTVGDQARRSAFALLSRFGLSPTDRAKLTVLPEAVEDPLEALRKRKDVSDGSGSSGPS